MAASFPYNLQNVLRKLQSDDTLIRAFLDDPAAFLDGPLSADRDLLHMAIHTGITYNGDKVLAIIGGFALLNSPYFRPSTGTSIIPFKVVSANGAFCIYKNTRSPAQDHFMKVGLMMSDNMEVESLTLRVLAERLPSALQRYYLQYRAAANLLVYRDRLGTGPTTLNMKRYLDPDSDVNFFGSNTINMPQTVIVPMLITNVVPGGLSLYQICTAWASSVPPSDPKELANLQASMRMFHKSAIYDRAVGTQLLDKRIQHAAAAHIFQKWNRFLDAILTGCAPFKMTHGDLHASNVMYDVINENFVMIDYGRCTLDLEHAGVPVSTVIQEMQKIESLPSHQQKDKLTSANKFYEVFENFGARPYFDSSKVTEYGMLLDLAPLTFFLYRWLKVRLNLPQNPILQYSVYTDSVTASSEEDIIQYLHQHSATGTLTSIDLALVYLALILHAAHNSDGILMETYAIPDSAKVTVEYDDLFSSLMPEPIFYRSSQPKANLYELYKDELESIALRVQYFEVLEKHLKKNVMDGGNPSPTAKTMERKTSTVKMDELHKLTLANYAYNAKLSRQFSVVNVKKCDPQRQSSAPPIFQFDIARDDNANAAPPLRPTTAK